MTDFIDILKITRLKGLIGGGYSGEYSPPITNTMATNHETDLYPSLIRLNTSSMSVEYPGRGSG